MVWMHWCYGPLHWQVVREHTTKCRDKGVNNFGSEGTAIEEVYK